MNYFNNDPCVSEETAELLKEAGFDWPCASYYQNHIFHDYVTNRDRLVLHDCNHDPDYMGQCSAPTLATAQQWILETYHFHVTIFSMSQESWMYRVTVPHQDLSKSLLYGEDYYTYQEALEGAINEALKLVLKKITLKTDENEN